MTGTGAQSRGGTGPPRRSLVTGGAGFIGSHLVERLLARGDEVVIIDDLSTGASENLRAADPAGRATLLRGDVRAVLPGLVGGPGFDEVYHLAAAVGVDLVMQEPVAAIETNIEVTSLVLRFAAGIPLRPGLALASAPASAAAAPARCRVLIASSSEVYGRPTRQVFSEDDDVVYGPTTVTRWSYAYTKAIDEYLGLAFAAQAGLGVVCVRLFNTVGPRQVGRYGMVLPRFVRSALAGEPLRVFGDGQQSRCFCDVRDVVGGLVALMDTPASAGRVFNLGSDVPLTIIGLAQAVLDVTGSASTIEHVPYNAAYPSGYEDLQHRRPDLRRVREAIGFAPRVSLRETIRDVAAWIAGIKDFHVTAGTIAALSARGREPRS